MYRHIAAYAAAALVLIGVWPTGAWAAGWLPPVDGGAAILGFGAVYAGGTHRGIDLAAEPGARVSSPADAVVTFAGAVPADGGGTCGAVTLELGDGRRVSLLPLDDVTVVQGDSVGAGDPVGALASSGDDSSVTAHLHLGLRRGDLYLDPGALLAPASPEDECVRPSVITPQVSTGPAATPAGGAAATVGSVASMAPTVVPGDVPTSISEASPGGERVGDSSTADTGSTPAAASECSPVARGSIRDAGLPEASAVIVRDPGAMSRPSAHLVFPFTRALTGWLLALGMTAVGASILAVRRASPVRVR